jgi:hypothetical protein
MTFTVGKIEAKDIPFSGGALPPFRRGRYCDDAARCWESQKLLQLHSKRRRTFKKTTDGRRPISVLC